MKRFCYFLLFFILAGTPFFAFSQPADVKNILPPKLDIGDLFNSDKGMGKEEKFDFGSARLVSCRQRVNNQKKIITALEVSLNPNMVLKKPVIRSAESSLWSEERIFYPYTESGDYRETVFFPIIYTLTDPKAPFNVEKEIELAVCSKENCSSHTRMFSLNLDAGEGFSTDVCPAVRQALGQSPQPAPADMAFSARVNQDNQIQIIVTFGQKVKFFEGRIKGFDYTVQKHSIQGKQAEWIFTPRQKVSVQTILPLTIFSSLGVFEINLPVEEGPFLVKESSMGLSGIFVSGGVFFFFSVFYLLFWAIRPADQNALTRQLRSVLPVAFLFPFLLALCLFFGVPLGAFYSHPAVLGIQAILLAGLMIKPYISARFWLVLLPMLPYLFLTDFFFSVLPYCFKVFLVGLWWSICCAAPFFLMRRLPQLFQSFAPAACPAGIYIRLPIGIMLLSIILMFVLPQNTVPFSNGALEAALAQNKAVLVTLENGLNLITRLNNSNIPVVSPVSYFKEKGDLILMSVSQHSKEGKSLLNRSHINSGAPFYLLLGPKGKNGIYIENRYFQREDWADYLKQAGLEQ